MAKMFYTLEEAKSALGKSEEEIKQFAREGRLREYRDGERFMFKAEQVEQLKSQLGGGDQVDLGVSDSGGLIGLVDTTGASGTSITLTDDAKEASGAGMKMKEDTALAADLGLSGSLGGVPSPGRSGGTVAGSPAGSVAGGSVAGGSMSGGSMSGGSLSGGSLSGGSLSGGSLSGGSMGGTKAGTKSGPGGTKGGSFQGINVFGAEEPEMVDPAAQTAISGGFRDQINLQDVGSGSGLLDLSRESDDTSLGAVLDEITPGGGPPRGADQPANIGTIVAPPPGARVVAAPLRDAPDPWAPAFGAAALAAAAVVVFGIFVLSSAVLGSQPESVKYFANQAWYIPLAGGLAVCGIFFVIGAIIGKSTVRR